MPRRCGQSAPPTVMRRSLRACFRFAWVAAARRRHPGGRPGARLCSPPWLVATQQAEPAVTAAQRRVWCQHTKIAVPVVRGGGTSAAMRSISSRGEVQPINLGTTLVTGSLRCLAQRYTSLLPSCVGAPWKTVDARNSAAAAQRSAVGIDAHPGIHRETAVFVPQHFLPEVLQQPTPGPQRRAALNTAVVCRLGRGQRIFLRGQPSRRAAIEKTPTLPLRGSPPRGWFNMVGRPGDERRRWPVHGLCPFTARALPGKRAAPGRAGVIRLR